MVRSEQSIWELLREASKTLPEPFSAALLIDYVRRRRPDVAESSIRTHISHALVEATNRTGPWAGRTPFLTRVERGVYRRSGLAPQPAATAEIPEEPPRVDQSSAPGPAQTRVVLVGCSSSKAASPRPARDLFIGAGFVQGRDRAEGLGTPWYVLSEKYGLLAPDEVVVPYDEQLPDRTAAYRAAWGSWVLAQLAERHPLRGAVIEAHAGRAYCEPLTGPLATVASTKVVCDGPGERGPRT